MANGWLVIRLKKGAKLSDFEIRSLTSDVLEACGRALWAARDGSGGEISSQRMSNSWSVHNAIFLTFHFCPPSPCRPTIANSSAHCPASQSAFGRGHFHESLFNLWGYLFAGCGFAQLRRWDLCGYKSARRCGDRIRCVPCASLRCEVGRWQAVGVPENAPFSSAPA